MELLILLFARVSPAPPWTPCISLPGGGTQESAFYETGALGPRAVSRETAEVSPAFSAGLVPLSCILSFPGRKLPSLFHTWCNHGSKPRCGPQPVVWPGCLTVASELWSCLHPGDKRSKNSSASHKDT